MRKKLFVIAGLLCVFFVCALGIFLFIFWMNSAPQYHQKGRVHIQKEGEKYTLIRDGKPYFVKGASGYTYLPELAKTGGNTIRTWDTTNLKSILDEAQKYDLAVIVGLDMLPSEYNDLFYADKDKVRAQYQAFHKIVETYKDHPALLMWCLGNELDFYLKFGYSEFYTAYKNLISMIREADPNHPITTTMCSRGRQDLASIRLFDIDLDLISMNRFSNIEVLEREIKQDKWLWDMPFMLTEWGIRGPWEKNTTTWGAPIEDFDSLKAERIRQVYTNFFPDDHPGFLGSLVFYWGQKQERTHTWFSLFDEFGNTSQSKQQVHFFFTGKKEENSAPSVKGMKLNNREATENVMLSPGVSSYANVSATDPDGDTLTYKWEILKEQWYYTSRVITEKPENFNDLLLSDEGSSIEFTAPKESGPYRIFVYVYDNNRHFASANIPFYVIANE